MVLKFIYFFVLIKNGNTGTPDCCSVKRIGSKWVQRVHMDRRTWMSSRSASVGSKQGMYAERQLHFYEILGPLWSSFFRVLNLSAYMNIWPADTCPAYEDQRLIKSKLADFAGRFMQIAVVNIEYCFECRRCIFSCQCIIEATIIEAVIQTDCYYFIYTST